MMKLAFLSSAAVYAAPQEASNISAVSPIAKMADELPEDINQFLADYADKKEDVNLGAYDLYCKLSAEVPETFEAWPIVGSSWKDEPRVNNPETFQAWDQEKQRNVERNWFTVYAADTHIGRLWAARVVSAMKAQKGETVKDALPEHREMQHDTEYLKGEADKFRQRLSAIRSVLRNATRIRDVLNTLGEFNTLKVTFNTYHDKTGKEKLARTKYPFRLWQLNDEGQMTGSFKAISTGDLLKFTKERIAHAVANGGTQPAFVAAIARAAGGGERGASVKVDDLKTFEAAIAAINHYIDLGSKDGREHANAIRTVLTAKRAENESLLEQIGLLVYSIDPIYSHIKAAYERMLDAKAAKEQAAS